MTPFESHQWAMTKKHCPPDSLELAATAFLRGVEAGRDDFLRRLNETDTDAAKRFSESLMRK